MSIALTPTERRALRRVLPLLSVDWKQFALACLLGSAGLGAAVALGATSAWLIARASQMPLVLQLNTAVVAVRFFGISKALFRYLERLASHRVALEGMATLRTSIYAGLADRNNAAVWSLRRGDLLDRVGADVDAVGELVVKSMLPFVVAAIVSVFTCIGIAFISPLCGLVLFLALVLSGVGAPLLAMRASRIAERAQLSARTEVTDAGVRILDHADELSVSGQLDRAFSDLAEREEQLKRSANRAAYPAAWSAAADTFSLVAAVIIITYLGIQGVHAGQVSEVALAVLALTPLSAFEATAQLGPAATQLVRSAEAAERITLLLDAGNDQAIATTPIDVTEVAPVVEAQGISVGWPGGPTLLEDVSLTLEPGRALGIVGPSGIGKSTLLYTLAGMIPPHAGRVTVGGHDISTIPRPQAAQLVSLTTEDAHVFDTSVLENLRVARGDLAEDEARLVLAQAGLGGWVDGLPDGLDTLVASGATTISGGERRRLLLARALASPAPCMLLDEPAEHLDPALADQLVADLLGPARHAGRGVLLVTHRLSALSAADEVLIIGAPTVGAPARVIARGPHAELARTHAAYADALAQETL